MIILIPMRMDISITHFQFDGDLPHVGDIYASFGVIIEKNSAAIIMCICDGQREFDRRYVAELRDNETGNTSTLSFNPRRVPAIIKQLKKEFLIEWNGGIPFIQYRGLIGEDYAKENPEKPLFYPNTGSLMGMMFTAMGFIVEEPYADETPVSVEVYVHGVLQDKNSPLTDLQKSDNLKEDNAFKRFINSSEWKH